MDCNQSGIPNSLREIKHKRGGKWIGIYVICQFYTFTFC